MLAGRGLGRVPIIAFVFFCVVTALVFLGRSYSNELEDLGTKPLEALKDYSNKWTSDDHVTTADKSSSSISYDLDRPPTAGCEQVVSKLQLRLIEAYSKMLSGIRHVNIWGYLDKDCDIKRFNATLDAHAPYSAIIMAGGGNFNDYYWEDQPSRMKMIKAYPDVPIRAFPQSVHMTHEDRINQTKRVFGQHKDLMLAARDMPSWKWLDENLEQAEGIPSVLVPDIAFMWGNRPDFRLNTIKTHDVLILARDDMEIAEGNSKDIKSGSGYLDLGGEIGNVTYNKVDWKFTHTPGIDAKLPGYLKDKVQSAPSPRPSLSISDPDMSEEDRLFRKLDFGSLEQQQRASDLMYDEYAPSREQSKDARAWAKAVAGFQLLGSAKFIITDRLHGHIMSTIIGTPHVLMDSKLGKNLNFHNTWTQDCDCVRITENVDDALSVARLYFEENGL